MFGSLKDLTINHISLWHLPYHRSRKVPHILFLCIFLVTCLALTSASPCARSLFLVPQLCSTQYTDPKPTASFLGCYSKADREITAANSENCFWAAGKEQIQARAACLQLPPSPAQAVVARQLSASQRIYSAACLLVRKAVCDWKPQLPATSPWVLSESLSSCRLALTFPRRAPQRE